ncbi:unnamed protein product [Prunus brigantina]
MGRGTQKPRGFFDHNIFGHPLTKTRSLYSMDRCRGREEAPSYGRALLGTNNCGSYKTKTPKETYELFEEIGMETQHIDTRAWRNHPNFSWRNTQNKANPPSFQRPQSSSSSLEDIVKQVAINQSNFQQATQATISKLEVQLGQIAIEITQREPGKWPSQTVINPKNQEAKAIHLLKSGKIVDNKVSSNLSNDVLVVEDKDEEEETTATEGEQPKLLNLLLKPNQILKNPNDSNCIKGMTNSCHHTFKKIDTCHPLHMFHQFHLQSILAYGKFIKNLNTHKLNFAPNEEVKLNKNVSAVLQRKLPPKLEDHGSFDIPINIGDKKVGRAMLDLGASINLMSYSVYQNLVLERMKKTSV